MTPGRVASSGTQPTQRRSSQETTTSSASPARSFPSPVPATPIWDRAPVLNTRERDRPADGASKRHGTTAPIT